MSKVTANKNKNSQQMLIIMVFNTVCHHFCGGTCSLTAHRLSADMRYKPTCECFAFAQTAQMCGFYIEK